MMVLDASALVKLVLEEDNSDVARAIYKRELSSGERIVVPYLVLSESLNTIWKYHTLRKELDDEEFGQVLNDLLSIFWADGFHARRTSSFLCCLLCWHKS